MSDYVPIPGDTTVRENTRRGRICVEMCVAIILICVGAGIILFVVITVMNIIFTMLSSNQ